MKANLYLIPLLGLAAFLCQGGQEGKAKEEEQMIIMSSAFQEGGMIPAKYTCDGQDVSPPLSWNGVPVNAKSLVLISDNPDAPMGT